MTPELRRIAEAVRAAADQLYSEGDYGMAVNEDLEGACGDVSIVLHEVLGSKVCRIVGGRFLWEGHSWVTMNNGELVDLTATQFGIQEPVYVTFCDDRYTPSSKIGVAEIRDAWGDEGWRARLLERTRRLLEKR